MKETLVSFLIDLEEVTLEEQGDEPTEDFVKGVKETIEYARVWFEENGIKEFKIKDIA